jgi:hypothetical protein
VDREPLPLRFVLAGEPTDGETLVLPAGPFVVVFTTTLGDAPLGLAGSYLGFDGSPTVRVGEVVDPPNGATWIGERTLMSHGSFTFARRALLYDHLQRLQELALAELGNELSVVSLDDAAQVLDGVVA